MVRIKDLDITGSPMRDHALPAERSNQSVQLSVAQIVGQTQIADVNGLGSALESAAQDTDLNALTDRVSTAEGEIDTLQTTVAGISPGVVVGRSYAEYKTYTTLTANIPHDDSIPQISEGTQILTANITMKNSSNRLRVRCSGYATRAAASDVYITVAAFRGALASAFMARSFHSPQNTDPGQFQLECEFVPGSGPQTISIRIGNNSGGVILNGVTTGRLLGGVAAAVLILEEITP